MHWRGWAAAAVLGLGTLIWIWELTQLEGRYWPQPGRSSFVVSFEDTVRKAKGRNKNFPTQGTIGYRDELFGSDPEAAAPSAYIYFLFSYALAPVLIDRQGTHPVTLVFTRDMSFHFEQGPQR